MAKKFLWINLDKKEYLNPREFYCGRGLWGTAFVNEEMSNAVAGLLASEWAGDLVIFLEEDATNFKSYVKVNDFLEQLAEKYNENRPYDAIEKNYCNIGLQYAIAEDVVKEDPSLYKLDDYERIGGLFCKEPQFYRFIINETKSEYIDRGYLATEPTPALFAITSFTTEGNSQKELGCWIGDKITVSNILPPGRWTDVSLKYFVGYVGFYANGRGQYTNKLFAAVCPDKKRIERCINIFEKIAQRSKSDSPVVDRVLGEGEDLFSNEEIYDVFCLLPQDYSYPSRIKRILKKKIETMSMLEVATYLTAIDSEERFYDGCVQHHVKDGTILRLLYRLSQIVSQQ